MNQITDKKAEQVLSYLKKASKIIKDERIKSDDGEITINTHIAEECIGHLDELLIAINNTIL